MHHGQATTDTLTTASAGDGTLSRRDRLVQRWRRAVEPSPSGLPNARVLWAFPLVLLVLFVALVATGVNGTSTGVLYPSFYSGNDPHLIAGQPQPIRSDEYLVQAGWTASQVEQGLPVVNSTFPGGFDSTVQGDFPSTDWSMAFRPHLLGFFFLPLDNATAFKWWLPGFATILAVYLFALVLLPRRPVSAAALAVGFFYAPFFQWWFQPITFWPVAWAFAAMAAMIWMLRTRRPWQRWVWAAVVAYVTVAMGLGVYVPFIVPAVFVVLAVAVGLVVGRRPAEPSGGVLEDSTFGSRLRSLLPLLAGGAAALVVLVVWVLTRLKTIEGILATVYPGERLTPTGGAGAKELMTLLSAPFSRNLGDVGGQPFGSNPSEASTFFVLGVFLVVPVIWLLVRDWKRYRRVDGAIVALVVLAVVFLLFLVVPGWDPIAHLLFLDRTTDSRLRMGWGIASLVLMVLVAQRVDVIRAGGERIPRLVVLGAAATALIGVLAVAAYLKLHQAALVTQAWSWIIALVLVVVCVAALTRGAIAIGAVSFLAVSLLASASVNPVYVGVLDLNRTNVVKSMKAIEQRAPGRWVGLGESRLATAALVQSGLPGYNGTQAAPSHEMWTQIDPERRYEKAWNRLASVSWVAGVGDPDPRNPYPDVIEMTFDSCAPFAQEHVAHVLSDAPVDQGCLTLEKTVRQGPTTFYLYSVASR